jgi:plasmid stabilization system protein ParE
VKLFWTETAKDDLLSIQRYITDDNPTAAKKWIGRLKQRVSDRQTWL